MNSKRLERKIDDLVYQKELSHLFKPGKNLNRAEWESLANVLIGIEQRFDALIDLVGRYLQRDGEQMII